MMCAMTSPKSISIHSACCCPSTPKGATPLLFGFFQDLFRQGLDLPVRAAAGDDHEIRHVSQPADIQGLRIQALQARDRRRDQFGKTAGRQAHAYNLFSIM